jgi:magnesium-transporting ATPase (P-type)
MGRKGTEAAKEAAEMVLADDNFASIAAAVEEGRTVYDNLRKAVVYVLPTSVAQASMVLIAVLLGMTLPITPVQILWVNMVTAVTLSLAIAFERPEPGLMARPPRDPREPLVNGFMLWRIGFVTLLLVTTSFGIFLWELERDMGLEFARTAAVNTLVMGQIFYLFNCRQLTGSVLSKAGFLGNRIALRAIAVLIALQLAMTHLPIKQALFGTDHLDAATWLRVVMAGLLVLLAVETEKIFWRRRMVRLKVGAGGTAP